jgi:hypothetical protein
LMFKRRVLISSVYPSRQHPENTYSWLSEQRGMIIIGVSSEKSSFTAVEPPISDCCISFSVPPTLSTTETTCVVCGVARATKYAVTCQSHHTS